jgi:hypothetical protein
MVASITTIQSPLNLLPLPPVTAKKILEMLIKTKNKCRQQTRRGEGRLKSKKNLKKKNDWKSWIDGSQMYVKIMSTYQCKEEYYKSVVTQ